MVSTEEILTMEIKPDRLIARTVEGKRLADGYVEGPASEIDMDGTYTFEAEIDGEWFRWTDQRPTLDGDRVLFVLRDGTPIDAPGSAKSY
jgi:hypothetical protein